MLFSFWRNIFGNRFLFFVFQLIVYDAERSISGSQKNFIISIELTENTVFIIKPIKNIRTTGATLPNNTIKKFFLVSSRLFLLADTKFFDSKQKHV